MSGNIGTNAVADLVDNRVAAKASAVQPQEEKAVTGTKRFKKKRKTRCDKGVSKAAAKHGARVDKEAEVSTPFYHMDEHTFEHPPAASRRDIETRKQSKFREVR